MFTTRFLLLSDSCGFVDMGRSLLREDGSVVYSCCWPSPAQSFSGPSPVGLETIFYCLRFQTSLFVASYDSQGHGGGIRPRLHTGDWLNWPCPLLITSRQGLYRKHSSCIVPFMSLAAGTCLPSRCTVTAIHTTIYLEILSPRNTLTNKAECKLKYGNLDTEI
jgi:hypothetical protein